MSVTIELCSGPVMWLLLVIATVAGSPVEEADYRAYAPGQQPKQVKAEVWPNNDFKVGQISGIDIDSSGNLHIFQRGSREWTINSFDNYGNFREKNYGPIREPTRKVLDQGGRVIKEMGANRFYMPHGLHIDYEDNVWLTDVALHQVFKIPKDKEEPTMVLGEAFVHGSDDKHFCQPTGVAVARNGDFFVADGYCNSRIMKFSKNGTLLSSWGRPSSMNPAEPGTLRVPHSLTLIEDWDLLCVADRENERIQCFSAGLQPRGVPPGQLMQRPAEGLGRVFAVENQNHYLIGVTNPGNGQPAQLFLVDLEDGSSEVYKPGLQNPHDMTVDASGNIYVGEIGPNVIRKIQLR